jgi:hypothetical protein
LQRFAVATQEVHAAFFHALALKNSSRAWQSQYDFVIL